MSPIDLHRLAEAHLDESQVLFEQGRFAGAMYLGGYALECALKFRMSMTLGWIQFPPSGEHRALKSHDLNFLLYYTGSLSMKTTYPGDWLIVNAWNPEMRYDQRFQLLMRRLTFYRAYRYSYANYYDRT